jgi:hypothetical protein
MQTTPSNSIWISPVERTELPKPILDTIDTPLTIHPPTYAEEYTIQRSSYGEYGCNAVLYIGSSITFWDLPFKEYGPLVPEGWMKHTWEALSHTTLTLKGPNLDLPAERDKDVALMDAFVAQGYDSEILTCLNGCRLFLGASHLSRLSTACGARIDNRCWQGKQHLSDLHPTLIKTHRPATDVWAIWRQAL